MPGSNPAQNVRLGKEKEAEERRLVEAAQQDRAHFVELYEKYFEVVYAYVARRTRGRAEAEDLTAETFRKALENLPRFKWTGAPFGAWLLRIASNLLADRARKTAREGHVSMDEVELNPASTPKQTRQSQQVELEQSERRARLFGLVDDLDGDQRRVIIRRFAEEKSIQTIARELGRSEGAVKQLQFRALQNLREMLGK